MKSFKMGLLSAFTLLCVSAFAQDSASQKIKTPKAAEKITYSCPMHPAITSDKPGKCSKCGMALVASKKEAMKMEVMKIYTCPMHADVTSDKPGKCPKCGMALTVKKQ